MSSRKGVHSFSRDRAESRKSKHPLLDPRGVNKGGRVTVRSLNSPSYCLRRLTSISSTVPAVGGCPGPARRPLEDPEPPRPMEEGSRRLRHSPGRPGTPARRKNFCLVGDEWDVRETSTSSGKDLPWPKPDYATAPATQGASGHPSGTHGAGFRAPANGGHSAAAPSGLGTAGVSAGAETQGQGPLAARLRAPGVRTHPFRAGAVERPGAREPRPHARTRHKWRKP